MRRGQPRTLSFTGDPGGARRRPLLRFRGKAVSLLGPSSGKSLVPMPVLTPGPGTDGNHSCGLPECAAADEDSAATFSLREPADDPRLLVVDDPAFHASSDRDDLAGHVARQLFRGEDDDLTGDVVRLRDLAEGHRP